MFILYLKYFCFIWVIFSLQKELRQMKYELSFSWIKDNLLRVLNCWKCFSFWLYLGFTFDILTASVFSFIAYLADLTINKLYYEDL